MGWVGEARVGRDGVLYRRKVVGDGRGSSVGRRSGRIDWSLGERTCAQGLVLCT